jgi:hypothetical protein
VRKDGGPAFPRPAGHNGLKSAEEHSSNECQDGMALRDYFAAEAMNAELASSSFGEAAQCLADEAEKGGRTIEAQIAFNAYTLADAMLKQRIA